MCVQEVEEFKDTDIKSEVKTTKLSVHKVDKDTELMGDIKYLEKVHHLGTGRYGETFEAIFNNRKCAIKLLHKALLDPRQSVTDIIIGLIKNVLSVLT